MDPSTQSHAPTIAAAVVVVIAALLRARLERHGPARRLFRAAARAETLGVLALLTSIVVVGCYQILLRNAFHEGILWADPFMRHAVLWIAGLGAVVATARSRHINIDVFTRLLPEKARRVRDAVTGIVGAGAAFALAEAARRLVVDERAFGETAFLGIPTWVLQIILPASFFLIAYRSLFRAFCPRGERDDAAADERVTDDADRPDGTAGEGPLQEGPA